MNPDFTFIWPLSCLKDGDHLSVAFRHRDLAHPWSAPLAEQPVALGESLSESLHDPRDLIRSHLHDPVPVRDAHMPSITDVRC